MEIWLNGPVPKIPPLLQPVAHALLQAVEDIKKYTHEFSDVLLWVQPAGLENTSMADLSKKRLVGRNKLPSTKIGLLFHAAEHVQRHVDQLLVTVKFVSFNKSFTC